MNVTMREATRITNMSRVYLHKLVAAGRIASATVDGRLTVDTDELRKFFNRKRACKVNEPLIRNDVVLCDKKWLRLLHEKVYTLVGAKRATICSNGTVELYFGLRTEKHAANIIARHVRRVLNGFAVVAGVSNVENIFACGAFVTVSVRPA